MLADLKEKASGIDLKRVYTAAAALLIAGAAGHFMQKTSGGSSGPAVMTASVPAVTATDILPPPPATAPISGTENKIAAVPDIAAPEATERTVPENAGSQNVAAAPLTAPRPPRKPAMVSDSNPVADTVAAAVDPALAPMVEPAPEEVTRAASDPLLTITEPSPERAEGTVIAAASDDIDLPPAASVAPAEPEIAGCAIDVAATAQPGAILQIAVTAPCNSGETVSFEHAGLKFSEQLGPDGSLTVEVPAMTGTARVALGFSGGNDREVEVSVPDIDAFDRLAVIWQGATGLQLHAFEGGADYDDKGHIWADTPGSLEAAVAGTGGFMTMLGSTASGFAADVYTFPTALMREGVEPEISIEAQVMENTCGGEIKGWILRSHPGSAPVVEPLTMAVPGCEAVGDFLVLKNLPVALKLARE